MHFCYDLNELVHRFLRLAFSYIFMDFAMGVEKSQSFTLFTSFRQPCTERVLILGKPRTGTIGR